MKTAIVAIAFAAALAATAAHALSADEAYEAVKVKRVKFDPAASSLRGAPAEDLKRFLALTDRAVVLRAEAITVHAAEDKAEIAANLARYDALIADFAKNPAAGPLQPAQEKIVQALREIRAYLAGRTDTGPFSRNELRSAARIRKSHDLVRHAYGGLLDGFHLEPRSTKGAFGNALLALDLY